MHSEASGTGKSETQRRQNRSEPDKYAPDQTQSCEGSARSRRSDDRLSLRGEKRLLLAGMTGTLGDRGIQLNVGRPRHTINPLLSRLHVWTILLLGIRSPSQVRSWL